MDYQIPGPHETEAQALCEAMGDDWESANMPGGLGPWYRRLVDVVLTATCRGCGGPDDGHYPDCLPASEGGTQPDIDTKGEIDAYHRAEEAAYLEDLYAWEHQSEQAAERIAERYWEEGPHPWMYES